MNSSNGAIRAGEPSIKDGMDWIAWYQQKTNSSLDDALDALMMKRLQVSIYYKIKPRSDLHAQV